MFYGIYIIAVCPYLFSVNEESLKTDAFLQKFILEIESGFPKLEKVTLLFYIRFTVLLGIFFYSTKILIKN